jgi:hypothetical protein
LKDGHEINVKDKVEKAEQTLYRHAWRTGINQQQGNLELNRPKPPLYGKHGALSEALNHVIRIHIREWGRGKGLEINSPNMLP